MKINWGFGPPKDHDESGADARKVPGVERAPAAARAPGASKSTRGFGPKKRGDSGAARSDAADSEVSEQHGWTAGANLATKGVVGLLWVALVAGPLALGIQLLVPERSPVVQQSGSGERLGEAAAVGEFAERAVVAWLETSAQESDSLREYFGDLDQSRPQHPWTTQSASVAEIVKDGSGLWSVVVGVDATEGRRDAQKDTPDAKPEPESGGGTEPADDDGTGDDGTEAVERITSGRLYFQVPVLYVEGEMVAQALPAPIPAPAAFRQLESAYDHDLAPDHPAFARVANFLNAMLVTGNQAELEAYSSPGTAFRALNPVPYAAVEVNSIMAAGGEAPKENPEDGERVEIQATVSLRGSNEEQLGAQYALVLLARQGRWEVAEIRTSPVLAEPVPLPTPAPTPSATSTSQPNGPEGSPTAGPASNGPSHPPADQPAGSPTAMP